MSRAGDDDLGVPMSLGELLDEDTVDAIVGGAHVDAGLAGFVELADRVRALGDEPLPPPSSELAAVLGRAPAPQEGPHSGHSGLRRARVVATRVAGLGVLAKVVLGTSAAAAGVAAAGAGGVLPDPVDRQVRAVIEAVSPVEFGDGARPGGRSGHGSGGGGGPAPARDPAPSHDPGRSGGASRDAPGRGGGVPGAGGATGAPAVPGEPRGTGDRSTEPGAVGSGEPPGKGPALPAPTVPPGVPAGPGDTPAGSAPVPWPGDLPPDGTTPGSTAPGSTLPGAAVPEGTYPEGTNAAGPYAEATHPEATPPGTARDAAVTTTTTAGGS